MKTRLGAVSGSSQRGSAKADSMSRKSPSESQARATVDGKARVRAKRRATASHSSGRESPKRSAPWRWGTAGGEEQREQGEEGGEAGRERVKGSRWKRWEERKGARWERRARWRDCSEARRAGGGRPVGRGSG
jgi:hypothetical protein